MAYSDNLLLAQQRLGAVAPQFALNNSSWVMTLLQPFLSADADTQGMITSSAQNMFLGTAQGQALVAKAADFNAFPNNGSPNTTPVAFQVQQAPTVAILIPAGTYVSTVGGITFSTNADATINAGATTSNIVQATALTPGSATNVVSGAITVLNTQIQGGVTVTNLSGVVGAPGTTGTDGDDAAGAALRARAQANILAKYTAAAVQATVLAVSGVYDAYVLDPQDGSGKISYYWCDVNGVLTGAPALLVNPAVNAILPPGITINTNGVFTSVYNVTALTIKYDAPAALKSTSSSTALNTAIAAAVKAYFQSLLHDQLPTTVGMAQYVNSYAGIGYVLTNWSVPSLTTSLNGAGGVTTTTMDSAFTAANTTIFRCTGTPTLTITNF